MEVACSALSVDGEDLAMSDWWDSTCNSNGDAECQNNNMYRIVKFGII